MNEERAFTSPAVAFEQGGPGPDWLQAVTRATEPCCHVAVLIVDPVGRDVRLLQLILDMGGAATVHTITDGRTAADRCRDLRPDLVLIDLDMPRVDGCSTLAVLRRTLPDEGFLPMIGLTRVTTGEARRRALDAGATDHVTTPFDHVELVRRVSNLLTMRALYQRVHRHNAELDSLA